MTRFSDSSAREAPTPPRPPVTIKGRGDGLRVAVTAASPDAVEASLRQQLEARASQFFQDAAVTLELPAEPIDLGLAARLAGVVQAAGLRVTAVVAAAAPPRGGAAPDGPRAPVPPAIPADAALVVQRTLRSGQRVTHAGTVVVIGDVNAGAEVIAGGSVVVWGRLRGIVEAGLADPANPPTEAVVCALDLAPTQLRIGAAIARAPEEPDRVPVPEIARARDGQIVVEAWP